MYVRCSAGLTWWFRWQRIHLQCRRPAFDPWVEKIRWRKEWLPTLVLLLRVSPGQGNLVGYSPWGHEELDRTEKLSSHAGAQQTLAEWIEKS